MGFAFIKVISEFFFAMLVYVVFDNVISVQLYDMGVANGVDVTVLDNLMTVWHWSVVLFVIGLFLWLLARSQKEEYDTRDAY